MGRDSKHRRDAKRAREAKAQRKQDHMKQARRRVLLPELLPFPATANYRNALNALNAGDDKQALALLEKEPATSPSYGLALGDKALVLIAMGRFTEAEEALSASRREFEIHGCPHPPSVPRFARAQGESLVFRGRYAEALALFEKLLLDIDELKSKNPGFESEFERERAALANSKGTALMHLRRYHLALAAYQQARDIYRIHDDPIGRSKVLTNFGHCAKLAGQEYKAKLAYEEAIDAIAPLKLTEQMQRIRASLADLTRPASAQPTYKLFREAVDDFVTQTQFQQAFVQAGIWLQAAIEARDIDNAREALHISRALETRLLPNDHNRIALRTWAARFEVERGNAEESLRLLLEGAHLWYRRVAEPVIEADLVAMAEVMHDHFRRLALALVKAGRVPEAVVAFETGRSLFHGLRVDASYLDRLRGADPFVEDGNVVRVDLLQSVQMTLGNDQVAVSLAILPPYLVAFTIGSREVSVSQVEMSNPLQLQDELMLLSTRLQERAGLRSIPVDVLEIARLVHGAVAGRRVAAILPHGPLHSVPWRSVLRHIGCEWSQLPAAVEFGLLLRTRGYSPENAITKCICIGYGTTTSIDFADEAKLVAACFGADGDFIAGATSSDVRAALRSSKMVHISCHGSISPANPQLFELEFELQDGVFLFTDLKPRELTVPLVILSACESGIYEMKGGDFAFGAGPELLRSGARACIGSRFRLDATFAASFFPALARRLAAGKAVNDALAETSAEAEAAGANLWHQLGCIELLRSP